MGNSLFTKTLQATMLSKICAASALEHAPAPHYKPVEKLPPQPYAYQYGVKDEYSGAAFEKTENQDSYGKVDGSYRVNLPDGRVQIVTYHADHEGGFVADVSYEGTAVYPPEPKGGYGHHPTPAYKPAPPVYKPAPARA